MADRLMVPPIRTALANNADGSPVIGSNANGGPITTSKEWYFYWRDTGTQLNTATDKLDKLVTHGNHADRLDPADMPEGALFVETDRGNALYQNIEGRWLYIAGTMFGTLSPDQRPTDLGAADVGFEFRTSVSPARDFFWSGGRWIEVTALRYGTHAARLAAPIADLWEGMAWMETDRGNVIYQNQAGIWVYSAGVMAAVLAARPADLGSNDAGFRFDSTDTRQSFRWSGSAWVETTGIGGAAGLTHLNVVTKVGPAAGQIMEGGITDESGSNSDRLHITAAGNIGIWSSQADSRVSFGGTAPNINSRIAFFESTGTGSLNFRGIGMANPSGVFGVGIYAGTAAPTDSNWGLFVRDGGLVGIGMIPAFQLQLSTDSAAKPGTSSWQVVSDVRVKENVEPVGHDSLAVLNSLNWVRYRYNGQGNTPQGMEAVGLTAQELREHLPEAVRSVKSKLNPRDAEESDVLGIDYHHILVHAARAIQQLSAEVERLKARLTR